MRSRLLATVLFVLLLGIPARADYLKASRIAIIHEEHSSDSPERGRLEPGETVDLASGRQTAGYYHVRLPDGTDGWVYRTFVRRVKGALPKPPAPDDGGGSEPGPAHPGPTAGGAKFSPPCPLPFAALMSKHPIDDNCNPDGSATTPAQKLQNEAKNNFCATGTPVSITYAHLAKLQTLAEQLGVPHGSSNSLPPDRGVLHDIFTTESGATIGEGSLVRLSAFVLDAHYSNVSNGESVNCKKSGEENNDIHIALGTTPDEGDLCNSVTAEISPHLRPLTWKPEYLNGLHHHPVRLTGQMFFDGSHTPCRNGTGSPRRVSVWEIHPVYAIDVCRNQTLAGCDANDESKWVPLEVWLNLAEASNE
jgi:hypothetical protein